MSPNLCLSATDSNRYFCFLDFLLRNTITITTRAVMAQNPETENNTS